MNEADSTILSNEPSLTYEKATDAYHTWVSQFEGLPNHPNKDCSFFDGEHQRWILNNVNGYLASVTENGEVRIESPAKEETGSKTVAIEIWGKETTYYTRTLYVEVPADATEKEIEALPSTFFDNIETDEVWEEQYSVGITECDDYTVDVLNRSSGSEEPDATLQRNEAGDLVLVE